MAAVSEEVLRSVQAYKERVLSKPSSERVKIEGDERQEVELKMNYLIEQLSNDILMFEEEMQKTGSMSAKLKILSTALAAIVTVLLGINITGALEHPIILGLNLSWFLNTLALFISAFLTMLTDLQGFYDSKGLWVKYTEAKGYLEQLFSLLEYMKQGGVDYISLEDINGLMIQFQFVKQDLNAYMVELRADDGGSSK
jgi:hypothetical protein